MSADTPKGLTSEIEELNSKLDEIKDLLQKLYDYVTG